MLKKIEAGPSLVVCTTCRFSKDYRNGAEGQPGGVLLLEALRAALKTHSCNGILKIEVMACLFACSDHCAVHLRSEGKVGYVLGRFLPIARDANAILDYVAHYIDCPEGVVPYERCPLNVRSHFIVRIPPSGFIWERREPVIASPAEKVTA